MVPYAASEAYNFPSQARTAYRYAKKYGPGAYKAGKKISQFMQAKRAARKRKPNYISNDFGESPGADSTKKYTSKDTDTALLSSRILHTHELTRLPQNTTSTGQDIDLRNRQSILLKGFKLYLQMENNSARPLHYNIAVLAPKDSTSDVGAIKFFRGSGAQRGLNFSNTLTSNDFSTRAINTDFYTVMYQTRGTMNPITSVGLNNEMSSNFKTISHYVKINRQIRYTDVNLNSCGSRVFLVYWFDQWQTDSGQTPTASVASVMERHVTWFKDTR